MHYREQILRKVILGDGQSYVGYISQVGPVSFDLLLLKIAENERTLRQYGGKDIRQQFVQNLVQIGLVKIRCHFTWCLVVVGSNGRCSKFYGFSTFQFVYYYCSIVSIVSIVPLFYCFNVNIVLLFCIVLLSCIVPLFYCSYCSIVLFCSIVLLFSFVLLCLLCLLFHCFYCSPDLIKSH